jgi:hypothetical protein
MRLGNRLLRAALAAMVVIAAAPAWAADTDWCSDTSQFKPGCERDCCLQWPRTYLHKVPRVACVGACWSKEKLQAAAQKVEEWKQEAVQTAVQTYNKVEEAVQSGIDAVKQTVDQGVQKVKEAICSTSAGKVVCDIVRDAANCYYSMKKTVNDAPAAARQAFDTLSRWKSGVGAVTASIVNSFGNLGKDLRAAIGECWSWISRSAKRVKQEVTEAVCSSSIGKPICDIVRDASECYHQVKSTVSKAPAEVAKAVKDLAYLQGGSGIVTKSLLQKLLSARAQVTQAVRTCRDWLGRSAMRVAEELCGKSETCRKFVEELKAAGITPANWTANKAKVFLIALRFAVPEGVTRKVALSAEISGAIYKVITGKVGGGVEAEVSRSGDLYTANFKLTQGAAVGVGYSKDGSEIGASVGVKMGDSASVTLNAANANDWKQLLMLGFGLGIRQGVSQLFAGGGKILLAISDFVLGKLGLSAPWDARFLSRLSILQERACEICLTADAVGKIGLKGIIDLGLSAKGETCLSAKFERKSKQLVLGFGNSAEVGGKVTAGDKIKGALEKVSGFLAGIKKWVAGKILNKVQDGLVGSAALGGSASITYSNVNWPPDAITCPMDVVVKAVAGKKPALGLSWSVTLKWGDTNSRAISFSLTPTRAPRLLDAAAMAMGPMGTFASLLASAAAGDTIKWTATVSTGHKLGKEIKEQGFGGGVSGELTTTKAAGSGSWKLADVLSGKVTGALSIPK